MTHHKSKKVVLENWELPVCDLKVLSKNILDILGSSCNPIKISPSPSWTLPPIRRDIHERTLARLAMS